MSMSSAAVLLQAIREEAKPGLWSSGVKLSRAGAVAIESQTPKETVMRVRASGRPVPYSVVLYPADEPADAAWECDCPSSVDPCDHVIAAVLALQEGAMQQVPVVAARWARVVYHFTRVEGGLQLQRLLAHPDGTETPLTDTLVALLAQPSKAAELQMEQCDLIVDRLLERPTRGPLQASRLDALLVALAPARYVELDGRPVGVSDEPLLPQVTVEDRGENLEVILRKDPRFTEMLSSGVALAADALWRLGETAITGAWLENLPTVRTFTPAQVGEVSARVLPDLARRFPVQVRSRRLPPIDRKLRPRLVLELSQLDSGLSVLPTLVYGAPPSVRIDAGKMTYLKGAVPLRDETAEQRLVTHLREALNLVPGRRTTVQGPEMLRLADKLRRWDGDLTGDASSVVGARLSLHPRLQIDGGGALPHIGFQLDFEVRGADGPAQTVGAAEVLRAWSEGLGLVPLSGGGWAPLPMAWLQKHGQRVADLLAARSESGTVANHALPQLAELADVLETARPAALDRLTPLLDGFERLPPPTLPPDVTARLRPYQLQGVAWLGFLKTAGLGGILADDMGLGKTLQAICVLPAGSLVVCPTSVLPNWEAEIKRFRPGLKVCAYHGAGRTLDPTADVTLTSYPLLRLDSALLSAKPWNAIVLDEAQAIKNPDSQVARAAFALRSDFRLALSGTPIENRLEELWSVMNFANQGLLGNRQEFDRRWAQPLSEGSTEVGQALRRRLRPFVLRRLKKDVAPELPSRTDAVMPVSLDERERAIYDAVLAASRAEVVALLREGGGVMKALEALLRLRQAACHSGLVPGQTSRSSSKLKALMEALETAAADGHKALVFSQWTSLLDRIEPELQDAGLSFERLDGSTVDRGAVTARFQSPEGPPVMLISLKAGGTGLNLTAADHVFLMDPWWNPAVEAQAADRAHRIGQERPVLVYRLISQNTVEERILALQEKKRALFDSALQDASAAASITRDDLLELFQ